MTDDELRAHSDVHTLKWSLGPLAEHFDLYAIAQELRTFNTDPIEQVPPVQIVALLVLNQKEAR